MKKILLGLFVLPFYVYAATMNIAVAANVSYAIEDLIKAFNATYPDTKVNVTLGSSGKLTAQIKNGAPYELFMSANMKYPQALFEDNIAITKPMVYAQGSLAILSHKAQDFSKGIKLAQDATIKRIAIANPKTAPYGKATVEAMKNANIYEATKSKYVYAESISQTVSYTLSATDIGFIAKSSLFSPKMSAYKKDTHWSDVDATLYTPINQGIVILKNAINNKEVKAFYDFMLSQDAKKILEDFGYLVP